MVRISKEFDSFQVNLCERLVRRGGKLVLLAPKFLDMR
jgi:hypothetical protein